MYQEIQESNTYLTLREKQNPKRESNGTCSRLSANCKQNKYLTTNKWCLYLFQAKRHRRDILLWWGVYGLFLFPFKRINFSLKAISV